MYTNLIIKPKRAPAEQHINYLKSKYVAPLELSYILNVCFFL